MKMMLLVSQYGIIKIQQEHNIRCIRPEDCASYKLVIETAADGSEKAYVDLGSDRPFEPPNGSWNLRKMVLNLSRWKIIMPLN